MQLRFPFMGGGANHASLFEAQLNYAEFRVSEPGSLRGRPPNESDERDQGWRLINESTDNVEDHNVRANYAETWPDDRTSLYYWRPNYWRRQSD